MPDDALQQQIEAFASWDNDERAVIPIVRSVEATRFQEFYRHAHTRLDQRAKEWAKTQETVPDWIGASHPLAPWELRKKVEALEVEWRSRNN
jgi:hypothetical protein